MGMDYLEQIEIDKLYKDFIMRFNTITKFQYRGDCYSKMNFIARINEGSTLDEIITATQNCFSDDWHKQNPKVLTPKFITRSDQFQKYLFNGVLLQKESQVVENKSPEQIHNEMIEKRRYEDKLSMLAMKKHKYTEEELNEPYIPKNS